MSKKEEKKETAEDCMCHCGGATIKVKVQVEKPEEDADCCDEG